MVRMQTLKIPHWCISISPRRHSKLWITNPTLITEEILVTMRFLEVASKIMEASSTMAIMYPTISSQVSMPYKIMTHKSHSKAYRIQGMVGNTLKWSIQCPSFRMLGPPWHRTIPWFNSLGSVETETKCWASRTLMPQIKREIALQISCRMQYQLLLTTREYYLICQLSNSGYISYNNHNPQHSRNSSISLSDAQISRQS